MKIVTFRDKNEKEKYRIGALLTESEVADLTPLASNESLSAVELLNCFDVESGFIEKQIAAGFINR